MYARWPKAVGATATALLLHKSIYQSSNRISGDHNVAFLDRRAEEMNSTHPAAGLQLSLSLSLDGGECSSG